MLNLADLINSTFSLKTLNIRKIKQQRYMIYILSFLKTEFYTFIYIVRYVSFGFVDDSAIMSYIM